MSTVDLLLKLWPFYLFILSGVFAHFKATANIEANRLQSEKEVTALVGELNTLKEKHMGELNVLNKEISQINSESRRTEDLVKAIGIKQGAFETVVSKIETNQENLIRMVDEMGRDVKTLMTKK